MICCDAIAALQVPAGVVRLKDPSRRHRLPDGLSHKGESHSLSHFKKAEGFTMEQCESAQKLHELYREALTEKGPDLEQE